MIHWSWFSFVIGLGTAILLEVLAFVVLLTVLAVKRVMRPPATHPLFKGE